MKTKSYHIFYRYEKPEILEWAEKIRQKLSAFEQTDHDPELVIVLGGDGGILEAARKYTSSFIVGFNFGTKGFLASAHNEKEYEAAIAKILSGDFQVSERKMIDVSASREGQEFFRECALNDGVVNSLVGVVELNVSIDGEPYQIVRGSGVMVATATGSTAYNLSAHGPIVVPELPAMIVTELLDHDVPTPSVVVPSKSTIGIKVVKFRQTDRLKLSKTNEPADVVLDIDGAHLVALQPGDEITVTESDRTTKLLEFEDNYFLKNIQRLFTFR